MKTLISVTQNILNNNLTKQSPTSSACAVVTRVCALKEAFVFEGQERVKQSEVTK